jgi:hypothetical protein
MSCLNMMTLQLPLLVVGMVLSQAMLQAVLAVCHSTS